MTYRVLLSKRAEKSLFKLSLKDQKRMAEGLLALQNNPFAGKKLEGEHKGLWSLRVWPYRIIYTIEKKIVTVTVVAIGDRKDVYKKLK
ncbi:type II toxin-antitoxin system RelE/ParE family toxin [Candidatus Peribacteria bacterium]|nr:type II toxin-antitoxin system RelE/ParE family toxin [Candidatus Peribacteria bacterium]